MSEPMLGSVPATSVGAEVAVGLEAQRRHECADRDGELAGLDRLEAARLQRFDGLGNRVDVEPCDLVGRGVGLAGRGGRRGFGRAAALQVHGGEDAADERGDRHDAHADRDALLLADGQVLCFSFWCGRSGADAGRQARTLARNSRVRGCSGWVRTWLGRALLEDHGRRP